MPEELFDVVDEQDRVIGVAPRSEVHAQGWLHRAIHVFLFNSRGQLLVQVRSATKDEFPLCYNSSASGHLSAGETYDECAPRELHEEIGISAPLHYLARFPACRETANEHSVLYRAVSDQPPTFDPGEVERGGYYDLAELAAMLDQNPEEFAPPFRFLLRWYLAQPAPS